MKNNPSFLLKAALTAGVLAAWTALSSAAVTATHSWSVQPHNTPFAGAQAASGSDLLQTALAGHTTDYVPFGTNNYGAAPVLWDGLAEGTTNASRTLPGNTTTLPDPANSSTTTADRRGFTITFNLNTAAAPLGYDLTSIVTFAGNSDYRARQEYQVWYSLVGSDDYIQLIPDSYTPDRAPTHSQVVTNGALSEPFQTNDATGAGSTVSNNESRLQINISGLSGVDSVRFVTLPATGNSLTNQGASVYREFDVIGAATVPEPSATLLAGVLGLAGTGVRRRRQR